MSGLGRAARRWWCSAWRAGGAARAAGGAARGARALASAPASADDSTRAPWAAPAAAGLFAMALLAAERFDEKRFFKAAQMGNLSELRKQVEALGVEGAAAGSGAGAGAEAGAGAGEEDDEESAAAADRRHELGWTALMSAAANDRAAAVRELLRLGARPGLRDRYAGAARPPAPAAPPAALQRREDEFCPGMNARASFLGWTALHYAALADSGEAASALLEAGADPTARDHAGRRPLHYARESSPVRELLLEHQRRWEAEAAERAAEERRRFPLERRLKRRIVGQRAAIAAVASAVRRRENGWADEEHPLVFLFLGSSGIGKTELAKQLARHVHGAEPGAFVRLDMSEYQERHEAAKLIGAPPGYVGHEEGGQLTRALQRRPDAVVLLDEVDKAHPDVLAVLLQLFDEGRLTDGKGRLIECRDAIFVMTSNLAADEIAQYGLRLRRETARGAGPGSGAGAGPGAGAGEAEGDEAPLEVSRQFKDAVVRPILKRHFGRDEFLGRINEIVYFLPFSRQELLALVQRELARWAERARARHRVELRWEDGVLGALADGYDVHYGARSIQHEVERRVVSELALAAERGALQAGGAALLVARGARLALLLRAPGDQAFEPQPPN